MSDPMEFLISMFPNFNVDVLRAAFEENNHQVESTVEYLLNYQETSQSSPDKISIIIRTLGGKSHTLEVSPNTTSTQLQKKVEDVEGVPSDLQRLIFSGKELPSSTYQPVGQPLPNNSTLKALGISVPVSVYIPALHVCDFVEVT